jgi:hypothetical protein
MTSIGNVRAACLYLCLKDAPQPFDGPSKDIESGQQYREEDADYSTDNVNKPFANDADDPLNDPIKEGLDPTKPFVAAQAYLFAFFLFTALAGPLLSSLDGLFDLLFDPFFVLLANFCHLQPPFALPSRCQTSLS